MTKRLALVIAFLSGFISLGYEIVWFRAISFVSGGSPAAFGMLLGYYLLGLAIGAAVSRLLCKDSDAFGQPGALRSLGWFVLLATTLGYLVMPALVALAVVDSWLAVMIPVAAASAMLGAVLPLVSHFGIRPDERSGTELARIYLVNILGSAAGSLVTGFLLLDLFPLMRVAELLAFAGVGLTVLLFATSGIRRWQGVGVMAMAGGLALLVATATPRLFDRFYERLVYKAQFTPDMRFRDVIENRSGVITVTPSGVIFGGGVYDGRISTDLVNDVNRIFRAYALAAFHPRPREVLMIGLSGGAWAQVLSNMPGVERLTIIEINPGYQEIIRRHSQVSSVLTHPRVDIVIDDGRRWLSRNPDRRFDLIVANTTYHWRAHATNLLSVEYLELIRGHLREGGLYFYNTTDSEDVFKTALTVFPHGFRLNNFALVSDTPVSPDTARLADVLRAFVIDGRPVLDMTVPAHLQRLEELLATLRPGAGPTAELETRASVLARFAGAQLVTDDNMYPEWKRLVLSPYDTPY